MVFISWLTMLDRGRPRALVPPFLYASARLSAV